MCAIHNVYSNEINVLFSIYSTKILSQKYNNSHAIALSGRSFLPSVPSLDESNTCRIR